MNKYNNAVVYKIYCKDDNIKESYIGSTCDFKRRMSQHKHRCYNENTKTYNIFLYQFIRQNGGWDCFNMEIVEQCNVNDKKQLEERERYYILQNEYKLNQQIVGRTDEEYRKDNKDKIKEWFEDNKEKTKEYQKEYYETNKEKINEKQKEYRKTNKEKINEIRNQKFTCACGGKYTYSNKAIHEQTNIHQQYIHSIL